VIWHLYDYYLVPAGGYFGAKKANELVHAQYSYDDRSVVVVNSLYEPQKGLKLRTRVFDVASKERFSDLKDVDLEPDSVARVLTIPEMSELNSPYFVRLDLADAAGKVISSNSYWLPQQLAELDWEHSSFFSTPGRYADMTALANLPTAVVEWTSESEDVHRSDEQVIRVSLRNASKSLAFLVHGNLKRAHTNDDVAPVFWDDNYISLLPGESRAMTATFQPGGSGEPPPTVTVDGWNVKAERATRQKR
jgi:exo-1,4-beta-D-glucosaminidase